MSESTLGLRERTRRAVQGELVATALQLFLDQGFDATTIEQIAHAAGLSSRSFFRYFASKDDVLAQALAAPGEALAHEVAARPAGEPVWAALRRGMQPLVEQMSADPRALAMTAMMLTGDALRATHAHKQRVWRAALALALARRLGPDLGPAARGLRADALSGAAIACLTAAEGQWVARGGDVPLADLLDDAMRAVAPLD